MNKTARRVRSLRVSKITDTIKRALVSADLDAKPAPMQDVTNVIEQAFTSAGLSDTPAMNAPQVVTTANTGYPPTPHAAHANPGEFVARSFTNRAGTRTYKLYIPTSYSERSARRFPLVVMLHGCKQWRRLCRGDSHE